MKAIQTGKAATISLSALIAIYTLSVVTSLPGLAIAPILGQLETVFKGVSQLEIQMLESLPSLVIIPCLLIAGKLSVNYDKRKLLVIGLSIFFFSSILYLLPLGIGFMLFNSILLGVGAGVVIPLSTGLIADFFAGERRTQQLGIVSAISNLSLVLATALAGFLAGVNWHLAFLVYCLSAVSLVFAFRIKLPKDQAPVSTSSGAVAENTPVRISKQYRILGFNIQMPINQMAFYFFLTTIVLVVPFNLSILMDQYHTASTAESGTIISVFFLSITVPGLFINRIVRQLGKNINITALISLSVGSILFVISPEAWAAWIGVVLMGVGYGVLQPLIYDRTVDSVSPTKSTFALALVMSMNYLAIILYPFFQELLESVFNTHSATMLFIASAALACTYSAIHFIRLRRKSLSERH